jgi:moderate conductance mechanosensitive channel
LSVRNIWLRAESGAVHVIPFSAVTTITNANRGLGTVSVSVTVAYKEDTDRVAQALRDIADGMHRDPNYGRMMLGDLRVLGVDAVKSTGVTVAAEIQCTDAGRLPVQREFNRRLQRRFQELGIELAG